MCALEESLTSCRHRTEIAEDQTEDLILPLTELSQTFAITGCLPWLKVRVLIGEEWGLVRWARDMWENPEWGWAFRAPKLWWAFLSVQNVPPLQRKWIKHSWIFSSILNFWRNFYQYNSFIEYFFKLGNSWLYNIILFSAIQRSESAICIQKPPPWAFLPSPLTLPP